jgi:cytochrome oxidase Cu insertion factor (SCO1/SenC/PrrC family)
MTALRLPRRVWLLAGAGAVVVAIAVAVVAAPRVISYARGPVGGGTTLENLDVYGLVPEFSLVEPSGRRVGRRDLLGKVWVANFIYTKCRETCPTQSLQVARIQSEFVDARDLRLVSITVDPRNDTREVLAEYAERYGADPARWLFLTGDKREIYCLARGLNLSVVDPEDSSPPACAAARAPLGALLSWLAPSTAFATHGSEGLVMHSARLVLVDRVGRVRAYHLATDDDSLKRLRPNLRTLLAEGDTGRS